MSHDMPNIIIYAAYITTQDIIFRRVVHLFLKILQISDKAECASLIKILEKLVNDLNKF